MNTLLEIFSHRLKFFCEQKESASQVAADLSINRQQFARYLSGGSFPRPALIDRLAEYFQVSPAAFFVEMDTKTVVEPDVDSASLKKFSSFFSDDCWSDIKDNDLRPGFYLQIKRSFAFDGRIIQNLVYVYIKNGTHYVRWMRVRSPLYRGGRLVRKTSYAGIFLKRGGNLLLVDKHTLNHGMTFHVFGTSYQHDPDMKPGVHSFLDSVESTGVKSALILFRRLKPHESVLSVARNVGLVDEDSLDETERAILSGDGRTFPGVIAT